jgi:hypothetical protein
MPKSRREELEAKLPPHLVEGVLLAEESAAMAENVKRAIEADGVQIEGLKVAYVLGVVGLEGKAASEGDSARAAEVARVFPRVTVVRNHLTVG